MISIDEHGDLIVKVTEHGKNDDGEDSVVRVEEFRVRRKVLIEASPVWRTMLGSTTYVEGSQCHVEFGDDPVESTEIVFRVLHKAVEECTYEASIEEIWRLVAMIKKWEMKIGFLNSWYGKWYDKQGFNPKIIEDVLDQRQLLFPCWRFNHAQGFATATQFLTYCSFGHITEDNPSEFDDLHLPHRIISLLNAAKGRLRTILHRKLYKPKKRLLAASCKCKGDSLWGYEKALCNTRAWPPEEVEGNTPMRAILARLEEFKYKAAETACMSPCHQDYEAAVDDAVDETATYFDGMCLDCMSRRNPKLRDHHEDYWQHNNFRAEDSWFTGCRIKHKQPSWYFSFMSRQEDKDYLQDRDRRHYGPDSDLE